MIVAQQAAKALAAFDRPGAATDLRPILQQAVPNALVVALPRGAVAAYSENR